MSQIFEALTAAHDPAVSKIKLLSQEREKSTDSSRQPVEAVVLPSSADLFLSSLNHQAPRFRTEGTWSHKRVRNSLILVLFVTALVLLGTNYFFRARGNVLADGESIYGVAFEGTIRPASEIRITTELNGAVSNILVKVGDVVHQGQQLLIMDDREARLSLKQASIELEAAATKLDKFRSELADADARVAISQRQQQLVPTRQWRDSPERAAAAYDQASLNYERTKKLFEAGLIAQLELDARNTELRMAKDDLEHAKELAQVSATLSHDQADQAVLQAKVTREELQAQLRQAQANYERAKQQNEATVVRATVDAVVSEIPVHLGDRVPSGVVVARLAKLDRMIADVPVAAQIISGLKVGQPAKVRLPSSPSQDVDARIHAINPLPSENMTHTVEVEFENPTLVLVAGQPAEVRFERP